MKKLYKTLQKLYQKKKTLQNWEIASDIENKFMVTEVDSRG